MIEDLYTALIVLTAGRSSRMGEPKALLRFGRRTALELAVQHAIDAGVRRVVAVVGHRAEEIRAAHSFSGLPAAFEWAVNLEVDSPMLVSLQTALRSLAKKPIDAFFFQPVDMPLIEAADFVDLAAAFRLRLPEQTVFVPTYRGRGGHPVLCDASLVREFLRLGPDETARDLIRREGPVLVEVANPGVCDDMDTREDYRRLRELYDERYG